MNVNTWMTLGFAPTIYTIVPAFPSGSSNQDLAPQSGPAVAASTQSPPPPPVGQATEI